MEFLGWSCFCIDLSLSSSPFHFSAFFYLFVFPIHSFFRRRRRRRHADFSILPILTSSLASPVPRSPDVIEKRGTEMGADENAVVESGDGS